MMVRRGVFFEWLVRGEFFDWTGQNTSKVEGVSRPGYEWRFIEPERLCSVKTSRTSICQCPAKFKVLSLCPIGGAATNIDHSSATF